jgi:hypothetical protein
MPANNDYPVLDGIAPSWADIIVRATATGGALLDVKGIKSINTGTTLEVGVQKAGGRVMKRTTGEGSQEASMEVYREQYQQFIRNLKDAALAAGYTRGNQVLLGLVHFGLQIQHTPPGSTEIYEVRIKGCRYMGRDLNGSEGTDADVVSIKLNPIEIADVIDGVECVII